MADTSVDPLIQTIKQNNLNIDTELIELAFDFANHAHEGQFRKTGEPYITHPLAVATTLATLHLDQSTVIAGLLHDSPEDTRITLDEIKKNFGSDVANLVEGITKLSKVKYRGLDRYVENLRKMFIAMASDIRTIFIKFADRIHNLQTLDILPQRKQERIAKETLEVYAPIANRLGIHLLKDIMEDLGFKYAYPKEYEQVTTKLAQAEEKRQIAFMRVHTMVKEELAKSNIPIEQFYGRTKQPYSVYKKMHKKNNDISKIFDLIAMRIIVSTISDCYASLGVLNARFRPLPGRIKDYIAQPKPNGYQSLHTTVLCDDGNIVEFQIRTSEMHRRAEYGIAAHWHYDEQGARIPDEDLEWVKEVAKWQDEITDDKKYLESLKIDVFKDRIFVFTPKGDVIDLPEESTPVDFAYKIHTDLGNRCSGAKINNQLAKLNDTLKSGDVIQILIDKNRKGPNPNWLKFVKTTPARQKIRANAQQPAWAKPLNVISDVAIKLTRRK